MADHTDKYRVLWERRTGNALKAISKRAIEAGAAPIDRPLTDWDWITYQDIAPEVAAALIVAAEHTGRVASDLRSHISSGLHR